MGIPAYFRIITQRYKDILLFTRPQVCDHFFVDFNGLIHQAAHSQIAESASGEIHFDSDVFEKNIIQDTLKYLNYCINIANPAVMIHTCVDGVAPKAKMNQQRKRRYLSVLEKTLCDITVKWDTNAISPGTDFMTKLQTHVKKSIRESVDRRNVVHYFSGSDEPGEGEHKLFARLSMVKKDKNVFIYGLDADLIMLSLMSHHPHIYLMREPQHVVSEGSSSEFVYLDIHALRVALLQELINTHNWPLDARVAAADPYSNEANNIIESYVTLCFLLGNDFLPHIPSLSIKHNGYTRLLLAAKQTWDTIGVSPVMDGVVNTKFFASLLRQLSVDEDAIMHKMNEEYIKRKPYSNTNENPAICCYAIQPKNKDPLAQQLYGCANFSTWRSLYYKSMFHTRLHDTQIITTASKLFIKGIFWTYHYYKRLPKDPDWFYPFNYAPSVLDLSNYAQGSLDEWDKLQSEWAKHGTVSGFVSAPIQLLCILPIQSQRLLPKSYQKFMTDALAGCAHMFPTRYAVQTYLKTYLWECTPVLPPLNTELLEKCVGLYK
jgi:5'-3' exoribonuclease 1